MDDKSPAADIWRGLTEAKRITLMSVRVEGALTIWRVGAHKRTITALREEGLMRWPSEGGGLTQLGELVQAHGAAKGYAQTAALGRGECVSMAVNCFKAPERRKPAKRGKRG